jgi:hypothetical protein
MSYEQEDAAIATTESSPAPFSGLEETQLSKLRWSPQNEISLILKEKKDECLRQERVSSYNQVVDTLHRRELSRRIDPIGRLPHEIITNILLDVSTTYYYWHPTRDLEEILPLTMVSKRWQRFILSEPLFWNIISLDTKYDRNALISLQLHLSQDLPLTVQVNLPLERWDSIRPELTRHRDRIETIRVVEILDAHGQDVMKLTANEFRKFLDDIGPLSNLRRLGGTHAHFSRLYDVKEIFTRFESLVSMPGVPFTSDNLRVFKNRLGIEEVTTYDDFDSILHTIQIFPDIKKVTILSDITGTRSQDSNHQEPRIDFGPASSLNWKDFRLLRHSNAFLTLMYRLSSLVSLEIRPDLKGLCDIARNLHHLSKLFHIGIAISSFSQQIAPISSGLLPNLSVRSLGVNVYLPPFFSPGESHSKIPDHAVLNIHETPQMMLRLMPNAEKFNLEFRGIGPLQPFVLSQAINCFKGKELRIWTCGGILSREEVQAPPSVQRLSIISNDYLACSLSSNSVTYLSFIRSSSQVNISGNHERQIVDLDCWPSLERIGIANSMVEWRKHSSAFLREVTIWDTQPPNADTTSDVKASHSVTSFIKELACRPDSYPSLEEITMIECPEWDILVIMLERRNLLTGPLVKRISNICMPSLYPPSILRIICGLLAGRWTERPSNRDLSLSGNVEIILDLSL